MIFSGLNDSTIPPTITSISQAFNLLQMKGGHRKSLLQHGHKQGSGGDPIPGGIPEPWRCRTKGHGLASRWDGVALVISEVFSNLNDTVSLLNSRAYRDVNPILGGHC